MADLTITYERSKAVDFLNPYTINSMSFITSAPKSTKNITFIYKVFEPLIWVLILLSILSLSALFFVSQNVSKIQLKNIKLNLIKVILNQQIENDKKMSVLENFIMGIWIVSSLTLTLIYSNSIYSFMVLPSKVKTIDTIQDLFEAIIGKEIKVYSTRGGSHWSHLKVIH